MPTKNPYVGRFISFEGVDGSGKSSQLTRWKNYLQAYYEALFRKTFFTKEPNVEHPSGREIYNLLQERHPTIKIGDMHPFEMQSYYFRNRAWHYRARVIPYLAKDFHVVSDRSSASICFGVSSPADFKPLIGIQEQVFLAAEVPFIWPDAILIYDVSADVARERGKDQNKTPDAFERDINFQMKVRDNYLAFAAQYPNCHIIDGSGRPEEVFVRTKEVLAATFGF